MIRLVFLSAILMALTPAMAQDEFNLEETVELCSACHGENGVPEDPSYPIIWGQEYFYIYTQLKDYKAGRREHEIMTEIAATYSRDQQKQISQYFADKEWPAIQVSTVEGDDAVSERAIAGGQCSACHGKWGGDSRIPRLAGQNVDYLMQTMHAFKNETRMNAPDKNSTMQQLDDPTIASLSRYLGSL